MKKTQWIVRAFSTLGKGTKSTENGITTYRPNNGWFDLKIFDSFAEADDWLCNYIRENHYAPQDFRVVKKEESK